MENNPLKQYRLDVLERVSSYRKDDKLQLALNSFHDELVRVKYAYNFFWLGVPILQEPQDLQAMQEILWDVKPDIVIETGIAYGGSLIMSASMLALLDYCDAVDRGGAFDPRGSRRRVIGVDIEIRPHNREAIEAHPMSHLIETIEGSSVALDVIDKVKAVARTHKKVLLFLDSNHTHDHVLAELRAYAPLVSVGSYCVVWDTGIEDLPENFCSNRPWGKGNNPKTAVYEYLKSTDCFEIDKLINHKLMITAAPDGFLRRIK
jgi:cephalosporin hydroxylase